MNLLTHFRKITILRFVLAGPVLLFSVPALFADGIASRYPNDVGIQNDPAVVLFDGFERYSTPSGAMKQNGGVWDHASGSTHCKISTQYKISGSKSWEFDMPITSTEVGLGLVKLISPNQPKLFCRAYFRYDSNFSLPLESSHKGIRMSGQYPFPCRGTPRDGTGWFDFTLQNDAAGAWKPGEVTPGYGHIYAYWPLQQWVGGCGDHWYPTGDGFPWQQNPSQYPDFSPLANFNVPRGQWFCYELMVKVNDIGQRNGEVKVWKDGVVVADFPDLFVRSVSDLLIDTLVIPMHEQHSTKVNRVWLDNVVIATDYIGPISPPKPISRAAVADFNSDGSPDYVLQNTSTRQTAIWYLNNNVFVSAAYGPTLPAGWNVIDVADFNLDGNLDYALFNASTRQTAIWYLSGVAFVSGAYGPTLPSGWTLLATADFNGDGKPDYVLYNGSTRRSAVWYMNDKVFTGGAYGPTLPAGWNVIDVADFNLDGNLDYALFNASTRQTAIWYLSGVAFVSGAYGPTLPSGWTLLATADFNGDGKPDYVLFNPSTRRTAIWYLNNNIFIGGAYGPTLP
jgi:FG-GAP-like repeat